ncbi:hypothetical protein PCANC_07996 [Puccinia coronata f. sp. avenae]|nr:hypothetical protein PCANC_07996 [Puccinia coronata f. sp. avenae]PLW20787.1 hypothetical protein PCASD_13589 [Puccinia coronata f. sp. avenae]
MFSGPVRGGTRGGQGDFKWSDVADDKDRENYLGHSILAPVGRWQKNKDITWYNKEGGAIDEDERQRAKREEIQRIKAAEEDALSAALGFKPAPRDPTTRAPETSSNAISLGPARVALEEETGSSEESEKRKRKEEKAARKAERAAKRERKMEEKSVKKISSSKSSKYPDLNSLRSTRLDRMVDNNDERTRDRRHSDYRPVADEVHLLKETVPLLANPLHTEATTLVVEIIHLLIQITIELTSLTLIRTITPAPLPLPPMIDIDAQFLQTIVVEITAAVLGRLHVGHIVIISTTFAHPPALFV